MKKILLIIAITLTANAGTCDFTLGKINKSLSKARNFLASDMTSHLRIELSKTKFWAINAIAECDDKRQKDYAREVLATAIALGK